MQNILQAFELIFPGEWENGAHIICRRMGFKTTCDTGSMIFQPVDIASTWSINELYYIVATELSVVFTNFEKY